MIYLVDTNVLLRFSHRTDPLHPLAQAAVRHLQENGHQLQTTAQNFTEFWNVSTRPLNRNGLGLTPMEADILLQHAERIFPLLPENPTVYAEWRQLVVNYRVSGVQAHDARLAAAMMSHGVTHILTFNTADFARYAPEGIVAVDPATVQKNEDEWVHNTL